MSRYVRRRREGATVAAAITQPSDDLLPEAVTGHSGGKGTIIHFLPLLIFTITYLDEG